jgi:hypothetical protein
MNCDEDILYYDDDDVDSNMHLCTVCDGFIHIKYFNIEHQMCDRCYLVSQGREKQFVEYKESKHIS